MFTRLAKSGHLAFRSIGPRHSVRPALRLPSAKRLGNLVMVTTMNDTTINLAMAILAAVALLARGGRCCNACKKVDEMTRAWNKHNAGNPLHFHIPA